MFWGTIHRMILLELLKIFILALCGLTGIILLAGIISEAMKNGFGPMQILACIPLLLPSLLPYTVPTTTLFTTCIVYGRLSADNEILALKAAGVHILHVVWPAVFLGLVASIVTMVLLYRRDSRHGLSAAKSSDRRRRGIAVHHPAPGRLHQPSQDNVGDSRQVDPGRNFKTSSSNGNRPAAVSIPLPRQGSRARAWISRTIKFWWTCGNARSCRETTLTSASSMAMLARGNPAGLR